MPSEPGIATVRPAPGDILEDKDSQAREWAQTWWDAWAAKDIDGILALVHEDVTFIDPGMLGDSVHGREQVRNFVEMFFHIYPDATMERSDWPVYAGVDDAGLAIPWRIRCTFSGDMRRAPRPANQLALAPTGKHIVCEGVDLYVFKDGLLHKWSRIANGVEIMAQMHGVNLLRVGPALMVLQHALAWLLRLTRRWR
jgi:uncharacterized protein (TIGR02246 family)